jgi:hypothetical protein
MFKHWTDNAIYIRLTRNIEVNSESLQRNMVVAGTIGLLINGLFFLSMLVDDSPSSCLTPLAVITTYPIWWLLQFNPIVVSLIAASTTASDYHTEAFKLVQITGMTQESIDAGYLLAAFHRWRGPLLLAVAMTPSAVLGKTGHILYQEVGPYHSTPVVEMRNFLLADIFSAMFILFAYAIGLLALNVIMGRVGIALGQSIRNQAVAIIAATVTTAGIVFAAMVSRLFVLRFPFSDTWSNSVPSLFEELAISHVFCLIIPLALAWLILGSMHKSRHKPDIQQGPDHVQTLDG